MRNNGDNGFRFPYKATSPVTGKKKEFKNMDDVYDELEACYDEIIEKDINSIGDTLYAEHFFFCNTSNLVKEKYQKRIKEYTFCKAFSISPYKSIQDTPANIIDEFLLIDNEYNYLRMKAIDNGK